MTVKPMADRGQELPPPQGKVIGFIDGKTELDAFAEAVRAAGFPASKMITLHGEDGIQLLDRLKANSFFFADSEDGVINRAIKELRLGHYAAAVEVNDHEQAVQITSLAIPHGGHGFNYFGPWVSEQLTS